jgi:hypothetical protein
MIGSAPYIAKCTNCGRQFTVPSGKILTVEDAARALQAEFFKHTCGEEGIRETAK